MKSKLILIYILFFSIAIHHIRAEKNDYTHYLDSIHAHDTLTLVVLPEMYVFPQITFKDEEEEKQYRKLVRDVKRTLPYAKLIYDTLIETYEYIETIPSEKKREEHLKKMEKELFEEYKPVLKKMSFSQGKLLIKLVDRECNQTSYNLIKAFLGNGRATFWQGIGKLFGANLKSEYDPEGKDRVTEEVVRLVEAGVL
ncbi:MAG: DUF4294 domain-containing protein [Candidatus Azobacteroides sp.]|nr:DUF4294 domain-containing protein [Candidatus Azobacteroides sp.]